MSADEASQEYPEIDSPRETVAAFSRSVRCTEAIRRLYSDCVHIPVDVRKPFLHLRDTDSYDDILNLLQTEKPIKYELTNVACMLHQVWNQMYVRPHTDQVRSDTTLNARATFIMGLVAADRNAILPADKNKFCVWGDVLVCYKKGATLEAHDLPK